MTIEVILQCTRHLTYLIDGTDDPIEAIRRAEDRLAYDEGPADDEGLADVELEGVQIGDRQIEVTKHTDWYATKTTTGLSGWKYVAYLGAGMRKVAEGPDRDEVIRRAFAEEVAES